MLNRPMAAWLSHLTRGWTLSWFWRKDILPAYREVTIFWTLALLIRGFLQVSLFIGAPMARMFFINLMLGTPATMIVMGISYIYGIVRLKRLGGPGIEEYNQGQPSPWRGQTKGF